MGSVSSIVDEVLKGQEASGRKGGREKGNEDSHSMNMMKRAERQIDGR